MAVLFCVSFEIPSFCITLASSSLPASQPLSAHKLTAQPHCLSSHTAPQFGNPFMARRSYLPTEVHWGHRFAEIIMKPAGEESKYIIDLNK